MRTYAALRARIRDVKEVASGLVEGLLLLRQETRIHCTAFALQNTYLYYSKPTSGHQSVP